MESSLTIAVLGGVAAMLGFGISDFLAKKSIDNLGVILTLTFTQLLSALLIIPYGISDFNFPEITPFNLAFILGIGLVETVAYLALYKSFQIGKLGIVGPISSSYILVSLIISFIFLGENFPLGKLIFVIIILLGVVLTTIDFKDLKDGVDKKDIAKGVPYALLVFLVVGISNPFWGKFLESDGWVVWVVLQKLIVVALLLFVMKAIMKKKIGFPPQGALIGLFGVALFEAAGSLGKTWAFHNSRGVSSVIIALSSTYSLITAMMAFVFLRERLAINQYFGIVLIILGLLITPLL